MPIADDLLALASRAKRELNAMSDFFAHSKDLWKSFEVGVKARGVTITLTNLDTGTTVNQDELLRLSPRYVDEYLTHFTFQRFVSIFETFFFDFLRVLLAHNPRRLSRKQVELATILAAPDREAIILSVIDKELNELKYDKVRGWFDYLEATIHLGCPTDDEVELVAEIKASRDVVEHNAGIVNAIYVAKASRRARHTAGEPLEISDAYFGASLLLLRKVIDAVSSVAVARLSGAPPGP